MSTGAVERGGFKWNRLNRSYILPAEIGIGGRFVNSGSRWSWEEQYLTMNLYCRTPFGKQHRSNPEVIRLAQALNRSPSSIAMKLSNYSALDPKEAARGVRGLANFSQADKTTWEEFERNWLVASARSEELWSLYVGDENENPDGDPFPDTVGEGPAEFEGVTEVERLTKVRLAQRFFRRAILCSYGSRCCISGLSVPDLLTASHILPWAKYPDHRVSPRNGLCLSKLHDAAFDRGLITFDDDFRLVISRLLSEHLPDDALQENFFRLEGKVIDLPSKLLPSKDFMTIHRTQLFREG